MPSGKVGVMKHEELLQVIDVYNDGKGDAFANALRAVIELHKLTDGIKGADEYDACKHCYPTTYPCPTIQAITAKLS